MNDAYKYALIKSIHDGKNYREILRKRQQTCLFAFCIYWYINMKQDVFQNSAFWFSADIDFCFFLDK